MVKIVQREDSVLRKIASEVPIADIKSEKIKKVIKDMSEALAREDDGVAIAAPQIGESLRIFVVSGKVFSPHYPDLKKDEEIPPDFVCINPEILKLSKQKRKIPEGCLSVRWLYGNVPRSTKATISGYDENGQKFTRGASGLLAQIFQHEIDHLNGVLFTDTAENLEEVPPENLDLKK